MTLETVAHSLKQHRDLVFLCIAEALLAAILLIGKQEVMTGDEPRYLFYASSILKYGHYAMPLADWQRLHLLVSGRTTDSIPADWNNIILSNGVYLPTLLSPIAGIFALSGLRAAALAAGLAGLIYLYRLCRENAGPNAALIATLLAGFTVPLLPYFHLFYMEAFIFALICATWFRLQAREQPAYADVLTAILILSLPFAHIRTAAMAATLYAFLLHRLYVERRIRLAAGLVALAAATGVAFIVLNLAIYGAVTGAVMTADHPPLLIGRFTFIAMQLFNVHHGLLAYAPVWCLGFAGLWIGLFRGPGIARQAFILTCVAVMTSIGVDAGEAWPARYWIQIVPMLAVGFCIWWSVAERPILRSIAVALIGFTLINTVVFFTNPNSFLENRQTTMTYQALFDKYGHLDFGLILPADIGDGPNVRAAQHAALFAGLFVGFIALAAVRRRRVYVVVPLLILAAAADLARVRVIAPQAYAADIQHDRISLTKLPRVDAAYLQIGHGWQEWHGMFGPDFTLTTQGDDGQFRATVSANQVIGASCAGHIQSITLDAPSTFDIGSRANDRIVLYRSTSLLRTGLRFLRQAC